MTRKLLVGAIVAGALTVTAGTAFALSRDDRSSSGAAPATTTSAPTSPTTEPTTSSSAPTSSASAQAQLTADDAARIAQARYGGTVREIEREDEHGRPEWKVEITAADGVTHDVRIDAVTGDLTRVDRGDDDGDDDDDDRGRHGGRDHDDDDRDDD